MPKTKNIPIDDLHIDPTNVRPKPEITPEFVDSVREEGLLEPVVVRPHDGEYGIVIGARRFIAAKNAGLEEIPCTVREDLKGDDEKAEDLSFKENKHRLNLPEWKIKELIEKRYEGTDARKSRGKRAREVAKRLNVSRKTVYRYLDISENLDSPLNLLMKPPSERTDEEKKQLESAFSKESPPEEGEREGSDTGKGEAKLSLSVESGSTDDKVLPERVAEKLAKSEFFLDLQEEDPERAHEVALKAAEAGQHKVDEVLEKEKERLESDEEDEEKERLVTPRGRRISFSVDDKSYELLEKWAEFKDVVGADAAARKIVIEFLRDEVEGHPRITVGFE